MADTERFHMRITPEDDAILTRLESAYGQDRSGIIRLAIRYLEQHGPMRPTEREMSDRIRIHWTIATDPSHYGDEATEEDAAQIAERESAEVIAYVKREYPQANIETAEVPERTSHGNKPWVEVNGERFYESDDPTGILDTLWNFVAENWPD